MRFTPAGVPVVEFKLAHESEQAEAGGRRKVKAELAAVAFEAQARLIAGAAMGHRLKLDGFMSAKSARSKKLVLHVTNIEFGESKESGD